VRVWDQQTQDARVTRAQGARGRVGRVLELLDGVKHALARVVGDDRVVVNHKRNRLG